MTTSPPLPTRDLFQQELDGLQRLTDRVFVWLLFFQWLAGIACAALISPTSWEGMSASVHSHVWAAIVLGGALVSLPAWLVWHGGAPWLTRMVVSTAQMCFSCLLIHLLAGRIEAHFHIFGSLALLSFYRDRWVFLPAVLTVAVDHLFRGLYWPESVFGVATPSALRAFEHSAWVLFETGFLLWGVNQNRRHLYRLAELQIELERQRDGLAEQVETRTHELAEERRLLTTIIDSVPHALFWKDRDSVYLGCNRVFADLAGLERPADIVGKDDFDMPWTIEEAEWYRHCDREVMLEGRPIINCEESQLNAGGDETVLWTSKNPLRSTSGHVIGMVGVFADVTEKVLSEREREKLHHDLADRQALLEAIFATAADAIIVIDPRGKIVQANHAAEQTFRVPWSEMVGQSIEQYMSHADADRHRSSLRSAAQSETTGVLGAARRVEAVRSTGETFAAELSISRIEIDEATLFTGIVRDVSERERLQGQLAQSQKMESIGVLAAGVAHEINTPMQFVRDNVEFLFDCVENLVRVIDRHDELLESDRSVDWQTRREHIDRIKQEQHFDRVREHVRPAAEDTREGIERVISIVRAMKDFSHPGGNAKDQVDLNQCVQGALAVSRNHWKYVARVDRELDCSLRHVPAFKAELNQVLLNLIVNAADAVRERHGSEPELGRIAVRTWGDTEHAWIEVTDNGGGVPDALRKKVFDPFFTTKEVGKGTGQGLSLAHSIVVGRHGGSISIGDSASGGAAFRVGLPLDDSPNEPTDLGLADDHHDEVATHE